MNATIHGIIDHMFKDIADTAETRALHEELLNNCLEHYEDLLSRGMSETEAVDAVVDSLKGMKEVIDEYPKKPGLEEKKPAQSIPVMNPKIPEKEEKPQEEPTEYAFAADGIRILRTDLKGCDLVVGKSPDNRIHVRCEDLSQIICDQNGSALWVKAVDKTKKSIDEAAQKIGSEEFSVQGLLRFIGKAIGSVASNISVSWNVYIDLPAGRLQEMDLNAKSGDVHVETTLPERLSIHSMSGDAEVEAPDATAAEKINISTMSGDIDVKGNAHTIVLSSMSGDVNARGVYRTAEMKSTSGDVEMNGEADQIHANTVSGDVTADLLNTTVARIEGRSTSGDVEIELAPGTDSVHTAMSTVSGSVSCRIPDSGAGARLQIQATSVSGDIRIR